MALSQTDRISLSKKITDIPRQNETAELIKELLESGKQKAIAEDNVNKDLMDGKTALVNPYQKELTNYNSILTNELVEQDIIDGADKKFRNFFFPNDIATSLPSTPDGIWKNFPPSGHSKAIGKIYEEVFPSTSEIKEQDKIDTLNTAIIAVEAIADEIRSSGQECSEDLSGTCLGDIPPGATDQTTCENNGGTWTPNGGPDTYSSSAAAATALSDLQAAIDDWKSFVEATKVLIQSENTADSDTGRQAQNNTAIADIDNLISVIDTWDVFQDFDTTTSLPSGTGGAGCALFAALDDTDFDPSKLRVTELQPIKDEITAREIFIPTRISEVNTNLGSITQAADGKIDAADGFYGDRFRIIDLRLNLIAGSLNKVKGAEAGQNAQDELIASNENAEIVYSTVLKVSLFRAPASGGTVVHLKDASEFNPGDNVFIVADTQQEISTSVISKNGNAVTVADNIPKKYRQNDAARLYREV